MKIKISLALLLTSLICVWGVHYSQIGSGVMIWFTLATITSGIGGVFTMIFVISDYF